MTQMIKKHRVQLVWAAFALLFTAFLFYLNMTLEYEKPADSLVGIEYATGKVVKVENDTLGPDPDFSFIEIGRQDLTFVLEDGQYAGRSVKATNFVERGINNPAQIGTRMVLSSYDGFYSTLIVQYNREPVLYTLVALFLGLVVWFGGKKGLKSIFGLGFTLVCIVFLFVPMTVRGVDAIIAATVVVVLSTVVSLFSLNGWSQKSIISSLSCALCTFSAGLVAFVAGAAAHINTLNTEEAQLLLFVSMDTKLQVHHLLFAGVLFAALGAVMDTSMSITSAIAELKAVNPTMSRKALFQSGMNIGKDVMGTMTNTLILAFSGSSINLFVLYYMYQYQYTYLVNMQSIVVELTQGLSGSIAVILSIPVSAFLASRLIGRIPQPGAKSN